MGQDLSLRGTRRILPRCVGLNGPRPGGPSPNCLDSSRFFFYLLHADAFSAQRTYLLERWVSGRNQRFAKPS
jgi:hypothetical protein